MKNWKNWMVLGFFFIGMTLYYLIIPPHVKSQTISVGKWEYRVVLLDYSQYSKTPEFRKLLKDKNSTPTQANLQFIQKILNTFGSQGWELVQVVVPKSRIRNFIYFYFKRLKT